MKPRVNNSFILVASGLIFLIASGIDTNPIAAESTRDKLRPRPNNPSTPQIIEGQVSVKYTKLALRPILPVEPGGDMVGPDNGTVVPDGRIEVPNGGTVSTGSLYTDKEGYRDFLKDRKGYLEREGNRLHDEHGVTVLSTNVILGTQLLQLPNGKSVDEFVKKLKKNDPRIEDANPNFIGFGDSPQTEPPDETKWLNGELWGMVKIGMKDAWEISQTQGHREIVVAVIDSGFDVLHPDLEDNLWVNPDEDPHTTNPDDDENGIPDDIHGVDWCHLNPRGIPVQNPDTDDSGHGTEVAGIIGARGNNGAASHVAGVIWVVKLMTLKTLCTINNVSSTTRAADAITYAVWKGAHIINNSYGHYMDNPPAHLDAAVNLANCQGDAVPPGCQPAFLVASAGNENKNIDVFRRYPASYAKDFNHVISVAAVEESDLLFWPDPGNFPEYASNWGSSSVSIAAPGKSIDTLFPMTLDPMDLSGLGITEATSAAAPFVAGCAALLQATRRQLSLPLLPSAQLKEIIMKGGDQVPNLRNCNGGTQDCVVQGRRLNCLQALHRLPVCSDGCTVDTTPPPAPMNLTITP